MLAGKQLEQHLGLGRLQHLEHLEPLSLEEGGQQRGGWHWHQDLRLGSQLEAHPGLGRLQRLEPLMSLPGSEEERWQRVPEGRFQVPGGRLLVQEGKQQMQEERSQRVQKEGRQHQGGRQWYQGLKLGLQAEADPGLARLRRLEPLVIRLGLGLPLQHLEPLVSSALGLLLWPPLAEQ